MTMASLLSNNAGRPVSGEVRMFAPSTTVFNSFIWSLGAFDGTNVNSYTGTGIYTVGTAINAIRFMMDTGNIIGTISLYGVRK